LVIPATLQLVFLFAVYKQEAQLPQRPRDA